MYFLEELGITSQNIDTFKENKDPKIQRFMGERDGDKFPHLGGKIRIESIWRLSDC